MKKVLALLLSAMFALAPATVSATQDDLRFNGGAEFEASGEYNSSVLFTGGEVSDAAVVHGIDFAFGDSVTNSGTYEYGFHAANKVTVRGNYEKDLFAFGNEILISEDAKIARDFYAAGNKVEIKSSIPGSVFVAANRVVLNNITISGDLRVAASAVEIVGDVKITGKFVYNEDLDVIGNDTLVAGDIEVYKPIIWSFRWGENARIILAVMSLASSIVIAVVFILIAKRFFNRLKDDAMQADAKSILIKLGIGLLGIIATPVIVALLAATIVGLPAAIILLLAFVTAIILSVTVSAAFVGAKIMPRQSTILSTTIILVLMAIIGYLPVVGWAINSIGAIFGYGVILTAVFEKKLEQKISSKKFNEDVDEA